MSPRLSTGALSWHPPSQQLSLHTALPSCQEDFVLSPERLCSLLFWSQAQDFLLPGLSSFSHSCHTPKCPSWLHSLVSGPQSLPDSPGLGESYSHGDFRFSCARCWAPSEPLRCGTEGTCWSSALTTGQMNRGHFMLAPGPGGFPGGSVV